MKYISIRLGFKMCNIKSVFKIRFNRKNSTIDSTITKQNETQNDY